MTNHKISTKALVFCGLMTALLCVAGPLSLPLPGLVPISLTNLALFLIAYLLGWKRAVLCNLLYLLIGAIGLPVFSGFTGGLPKLAGPTGGYLLGFVGMTMLCGLAVEKFPSNRPIHCLGMAAG
ncbi:MAG: biotin transporter BioY, partial [Oscillospiraceae bacterium]